MGGVSVRASEHCSWAGGHKAFVQYIADLFKFKRLRFRASRFQVTAHGEVDGKHLSVMLHLSNYRARTLVPTLHVPYSLVYTFSQDYPYFEHVWTSMVANTDGNQLISVTNWNGRDPRAWLMGHCTTGEQKDKKVLLGKPDEILTIKIRNCCQRGTCSR